MQCSMPAGEKDRMITRLTYFQAMHDANTVDDMTKKCFETSNQVYIHFSLENNLN